MLLAWTLITFSAGWFFFGGPFNAELVGAASRGDAPKVRRLLRWGASPNSYHLEGSSALWWAVSSGSLETVQLLLEKGADPNSRGQWNSVIEQAAALAPEPWDREQERRAIVRALLDRAAQIRDPAQVKLLKDALQKKPTK